MLKRSILAALWITLLALGILAACSPGAVEAPATEEAVVTDEPTEEAVVATEEAEPTEAPTEAATEAPTPTEEAFAAPEGALASFPVDEAPVLDGVADDAAWADATVLEIPVAGGENESDTTVQIRSVYSGDMVYFVATWADPTQSFVRSPWVLQEDGTWAKLTDPDDQGGDNNLYYEDKLAMIWPIDNSIPNFESAGCFTACHAGENSDIKPFGNKYTEEEGQLGDIWHWKSVRNVGQIDDQYLDHIRLDPNDLDNTREAGRHSDPKDAGGYSDNVTEDKSGPMYMLPGGPSEEGAPGFILDSEKVEIDLSLFEPGDMVPGIIVAPIEGDRGDLSAGWVWADGTWTLEWSRALETGSEFDVQFNDLTATYYFGIAVFDNVQVRHAFSTGGTPFVFAPAE